MIHSVSTKDRGDDMDSEARGVSSADQTLGRQTDAMSWQKDHEKRDTVQCIALTSTLK
jgi:hypothetical protein